MMAQSRNSRWTFDTFMTIATTFGLWLTQSQVTEAVNTTFTWDSITPSPEIVWHRCFDVFDCARLQVPLDYLDTENTSGNTTAIAIIKYPSQSEFPEYSEKWGGPVLTNPGGPGMSGVDLVLSRGPYLQQVVGAQFSIIGFDPRGVGNTRPRIDCFDSVADRLTWSIRGGRNPGKNKDLIAEMLVKTKHMEQICSESPKLRELLMHVGTASVAKDMLVMNEAIWDLANPGVHRKGVQYWGFSYGTVLGVTFATLFPKEVERMVLDGVVDIHDWVAQRQLKMLDDTEHVWNSFYTFCSKAGPERCSFHTGTKPSHIHARFHSLLTELHKQPLGYMISSPSNPAISSGQAGVLNHLMLKRLIFDYSYDPLVTFPILAKTLLLLETTLNSGESIVNSTAIYEIPLTCNKTEDAITNERALLGEAYVGIYCGDAMPKLNYTASDHLIKIHHFENQTTTFGETMGNGGLTCSGWKVQAKWKANFPKEDRSTHGNGPKGAAPILFVSTTGDPVTPLANAYAMTKLFPKHGAFVGVQEGEGHCTIASPSDCMAMQIGTYFAEGKIARTKSERFCARQLAPFLGQVDKRDDQVHKGREALGKIGEGINRIHAFSLGRF